MQSIDVTYEAKVRVDCGSFCRLVRIGLLAQFLCKVIEPGGNAWDKIVELRGLMWSKIFGPDETTHGKIIGHDGSKWV
jgi:hypothetical protein